MADDRRLPAYTQKCTQAPMSSFNDLLEAHCPIKKYCNWDTQEKLHISMKLQSYVTFACRHVKLRHESTTFTY